MVVVGVAVVVVGVAEGVVGLAAAAFLGEDGGLGAEDFLPTGAAAAAAAAAEEEATGGVAAGFVTFVAPPPMAAGAGAALVERGGDALCAAFVDCAGVRVAGAGGDAALLPGAGAGAGFTIFLTMVLPGGALVNGGDAGAVEAKEDGAPPAVPPPTAGFTACTISGRGDVDFRWLCGGVLGRGKEAVDGETPGACRGDDRSVRLVVVVVVVVVVGVGVLGLALALGFAGTVAKKPPVVAATSEVARGEVLEADVVRLPDDWDGT